MRASAHWTQFLSNSKLFSHFSYQKIEFRIERNDSEYVMYMRLFLLHNIEQYYKDILRNTYVHIAICPHFSRAPVRVYGVLWSILLHIPINSCWRHIHTYTHISIYLALKFIFHFKLFEYFLLDWMFIVKVSYVDL